jgi:hypothetical protein
LKETDGNEEVLPPVLDRTVKNIPVAVLNSNRGTLSPLDVEERRGEPALRCSIVVTFLP